MSSFARMHELLSIALGLQRARYPIDVTTGRASLCQKR